MTEYKVDAEQAKRTRDEIAKTKRFDISIYDVPFSKLPDPKRVWIGEPGSKEEGLGRLTLLTSEVVAAAAASEIKTGQRCGLNWSMTKLEHSQFGRQNFKHKVIPLTPPGGFGACFDDAYEFNPQQSSQWDGFRHHSQALLTSDSLKSQDRIFYGGTTISEILDTNNKRIGTHHWCSEGLAGRGVLVDYASWAASQSPPIEYSTFSTHAISFDTLQQILKETKTEVRKGDVLFVRTGVMQEWEGWSDEQKREYQKQKTPEHAGVEASLELLEWVWDSGIVAVAGDAISWEVYPTPGKVSCHEYMLAGWGMPIGELFDLDALAKLCKELGRYSFFFTSIPLNVPGGVSSPPNAMAIF